MYPFLIEKLTKHEISGHCFPYIDKEYSEVNEALGEILQEYVTEYPSIEYQASIDYNAMEYQTYVQIMNGKATGEKIKTDEVTIQYFEGIACAISLLAPVFTISFQRWQTTRYIANNQLITTAPSPNFSDFLDSSKHLQKCESIANFMESKGLISFQDALIYFPEIEKNDLFKALFFIND